MTQQLSSTISLYVYDDFFKSCTTVVAANGFSDWDFNEAMSKENGRNICEEIEETVVNHFAIIENMATETIYDKLSKICVDLNISQQ